MGLTRGARVEHTSLQVGGRGDNFSDIDNEHNEHANSYYISYGSFCLMLSVCLFLNISDVKNSYFNETDASERCVLEQLNELRMKNPPKVMLGHLNINSIPNKFEGIMDLVAKVLDIFLISETKIDNSFPDAQF